MNHVRETVTVMLISTKTKYRK